MNLEGVNRRRWDDVLAMMRAGMPTGTVLRVEYAVIQVDMSVGRLSLASTHNNVDDALLACTDRLAEASGNPELADNDWFIQPRLYNDPA